MVHRNCSNSHCGDDANGPCQIVQQAIFFVWWLVDWGGRGGDNSIGRDEVSSVLQEQSDSVGEFKGRSYMIYLLFKPYLSLCTVFTLIALITSFSWSRERLRVGRWDRPVVISTWWSLFFLFILGRFGMSTNIPRILCLFYSLKKNCR